MSNNKVSKENTTKVPWYKKALSTVVSVVVGVAVGVGGMLGINKDSVSQTHQDVQDIHNTVVEAIELLEAGNIEGAKEQLGAAKDKFAVVVEQAEAVKENAEQLLEQAEEAAK